MGADKKTEKVPFESALLFALANIERFFNAEAQRTQRLAKLCGTLPLRVKFFPASGTFVDFRVSCGYSFSNVRNHPRLSVFIRGQIFRSGRFEGPGSVLEY